MSPGLRRAGERRDGPDGVAGAASDAYPADPAPPPPPMTTAPAPAADPAAATESDAAPRSAPDAAGRSERGRPTALELAKICTEFRGRDVAVLDLSAVTPVFDYFVLATGSSRRQMVALAEESDARMKRAGTRKLGGEGDDGGAWILRDYGDVVLHVFTEEARDLYDLEGLWGDAVRVDWRAALGLPAEPADDAGGSPFADPPAAA